MAQLGLQSSRQWARSIRQLMKGTLLIGKGDRRSNHISFDSVHEPGTGNGHEMVPFYPLPIFLGSMIWDGSRVICIVDGVLFHHICSSISFSTTSHEKEKLFAPKKQRLRVFSFFHFFIIILSLLRTFTADLAVSFSPPVINVGDSSCSLCNLPSSQVPFYNNSTFFFLSF